MTVHTLHRFDRRTLLSAGAASLLAAHLPTPARAASSGLKVTVVTGSPHRHGSSFLLTDEFIRGAKEVGAEVYRSAHVALSLWCFLAAAVHAGLHGGIVAGKLAPRLQPLQRTVGPWGLRGLGIVFLAFLLWLTVRAYVARDVGYALLAESAYLYVEPRELSILLPLDLLIAFVALASLVYAVDQALTRRPS